MSTKLFSRFSAIFTAVLLLASCATQQHPANSGASLPAQEVTNFTVRPKKVILGEGVVLFGVRDEHARHLWWMRSKPETIGKWRAEEAVLPQWNKANELEILIIPRGNSLVGFEGTAKKQGPYPGGGDQIYIPNAPASWSKIQPWP